MSARPEERTDRLDPWFPDDDDVREIAVQAYALAEAAYPKNEGQAYFEDLLIRAVIGVCRDRLHVRKPPELRTQHDKIEAVAQVIYEARSSWPWHLATEEMREQVRKEAHKAIDKWESLRAKAT